MAEEAIEVCEGGQAAESLKPISEMSLGELARGMVKTIYPLCETSYVTDHIKQEAEILRDSFEACLRVAVQNERRVNMAIATNEGAHEVARLIMERNA